MIDVNEVQPMPEESGADVVDAVTVWLRRFIAVTDDRDLALLALWIVSTHMAEELYTSPRIQLDSTMPGSGKTTVLDHMHRLCHDPVQAASLSSPALIPRLLENGTRTILLDEVDRSLRPDKPDVQDLIAILNSGYRRGATRPVLVRVSGGGWGSQEMPTFAPVAMAGNSPQLPDDTRSRSIRILLTPDLDGTVEDSDWENIEDAVVFLRSRIEVFVEAVREQARGLEVDLPDGCIGRSKEKWRPLKRVAALAGGRWPEVADELTLRDMAEDEARREAGLRELPDGVTVLMDLRAVWPEGESFVATVELVPRLIAHNQERWGAGSKYGKLLTSKRLGLLLEQAAKVTSERPGGRGPRGYRQAQLQPWWDRHRIGAPGSSTSGASGESGESGADHNRMNRINRVHRVEEDGVREAEHETLKPIETAGGDAVSTAAVSDTDPVNHDGEADREPPHADPGDVSTPAVHPDEASEEAAPQRTATGRPPTPLNMPGARQPLAMKRTG